LIDFLADRDIAVSEDGDSRMVVNFLADVHRFPRREGGDDTILDHLPDTDRALERDDVRGRVLVDAPVNSYVSLGRDDGVGMLVYVLADAHRHCRKARLATVVYLHADVDLTLARGYRRMRVVVDRLTDRHVACGGNLNDRVLVDAFAYSHRRGGFELCLSPLLYLVGDSDAPVPALESYIAIPANVVEGEVPVEGRLDNALARIGAEVKGREIRLFVLSQD